MNKKFSAMLALIFCALVVQAQDVPPDANWESDPLDVLEPRKAEPLEPSVPEFKEIEPGQEGAAPLPELIEPAFPPAEPPPARAKKEAPMPVYGGSEPDYTREAEFHRIYKTYNEQPTSVEAWEKAVGPRESEVYQVQKGDTLSGISGTFFNDPFFWPKVWSLNKDNILNPHEIEPGQRVRFYPGSMDEAPTLSVVSVKEETVTKEDGTEEVRKETTKTALPVPKKRTPVLKSLPDSLPMYRMGVLNAPRTEVQVELPKNTFPAGLEYLDYYIVDAPVQGLGVITATEVDSKTAGDYQIVYVRLDGNGSKEYIVQKNLSTVKDPSVKERKGHMVEVQGELEILERVNEGKNIYRALVKKTVHPIEVGALLTPGKLPMIDPTLGSLESGVGAKIMGGQFDRERTLFGSNALVFLDAGANQGLQVGQSLAIFADEKARNKSDAVSNDRVIGTAKIVKVSGNFATAYVARATDDILLGDYVGKPSVRAFNQTPAAPGVKKGNDEDFEKEFEESTPSESPAPGSGTDDSDLEL